MELTIETAVFAVVLVTGLLSSYTTRVISRGFGGRNFLLSQPWPRAILGGLAFPILVSAIVWGFLNIPWFWVIGGFLAVSLLVVPAAFGRDAGNRAVHWYSVQWALDLATILATGWLWFAAS